MAPVTYLALHLTAMAAWLPALLSRCRRRSVSPQGDGQVPVTVSSRRASMAVSPVRTAWGEEYSMPGQEHPAAHARVAGSSTRAASEFRRLRAYCGRLLLTTCVNGLWAGRGCWS